MDYVCTLCGKVKGAATDWLLGFEGTSKAMKGNVTLLGWWDEKRAGEPNAIYFCSRACQMKYLAANYGDDSWAA